MSAQRSINGHAYYNALTFAQAELHVSHAIAPRLRKFYPFVIWSLTEFACSVTMTP
jgi:hypothetical protein